MRNKYIVILLSSFLFMNCDCNCEPDCINVVCTEEFVIITVSITDSMNNPVIDNYKVININAGTDITDELKDYYQSYPYDGMYPIFDDRYQLEYQNQEVELQFIGLYDGNEIINEYFLVGANCCHVYPVSGNYVITFDY